MNLRDLEYLVAVANERSFGRAAKICHVSQPTLSGQLKKLELELGVTLFDRTNRSVTPTPIGMTIVDAARRVLAEVQIIHAMAQDAQHPLGGTFRLGAFPTLSPYLFPVLMPRLRRRLSDLRVLLVEEKTAVLLDQLKRGRLDAALLAVPIPETELTQRVLFSEPFYLAVPSDHPLAAKPQIAQEQLNDFGLMLLEEGHCLRDQALELCHRYRVVEQDFRATSLETLRLMVKAGYGVTLVPQVAISNTDDDLRYIPFMSPSPSRTIALVHRGDFARHQLLDHLQTEIEASFLEIGQRDP